MIQILTNDVQMLILCLSYLITTVTATKQPPQNITGSKENIIEIEGFFTIAISRDMYV